MSYFGPKAALCQSDLIIVVGLYVNVRAFSSLKLHAPNGGTGGHH